MKKYYIVYAHKFADMCAGCGTEKEIITICESEQEVKQTIKDFRKQTQQNQYWYAYHTDKKRNIICSYEIIEKK